MSEQNTQIIKAERTPLYTVARGIFNVLFRTVAPIKYHNAERLQNLTPPYILIGNHKCMFDPMALAVPISAWQPPAAPAMDAFCAITWPMAPEKAWALEEPWALTTAPCTPSRGAPPTSV